MFSSRLPLVIDDQPLRKSLFKTASEVLKKIEKLEKEIANFHEKDQSLYHNWYHVTFKAELEKVDKLYDEYNKLAHFHNSVLAQANMYDQSHTEALSALRREEKRYEKGSEDQKRKIQELRLKREEFIEQNRAANNNSDDIQMNEDLRQRKEAFYFFEYLLAAIEQRQGFKILSMWDKATPEMRLEAEESFHELRGVSIAAFIEMLRHEKSLIDEKESSVKAPDTGLTPKNRLNAKALYRKLARRLHPDVIKVSDKVTDVWVQQTWLKVQDAYKKNDAEALDRLDLITLIRMEELHEISLDEIRASEVALNREFQDLRFSIRDLKKHPAWKFSTKRTFDTLKSKIREKLRRELEPLKYDVEHLRKTYGRR